MKKWDDRRSFKIGGMDAEELIYNNWEPGIKKLAWVRPPFEKVVVDGLPNPFAHKNFDASSCEAEVRLQVAKEFCNHWKIGSDQEIESVCNGLGRNNSDSRGA